MKHNKDQLSFSAGTLAQAGNEDFITDFLHTFYSPHIAICYSVGPFFSTISDGPTNGRSHGFQTIIKSDMFTIIIKIKDTRIISVFNFDPTSISVLGLVKNLKRSGSVQIIETK